MPMYIQCQTEEGQSYYKINSINRNHYNSLSSIINHDKVMKYLRRINIADNIEQKKSIQQNMKEKTNKFKHICDRQYNIPLQEK